MKLRNASLGKYGGHSAVSTELDGQHCAQYMNRVITENLQKKRTADNKQKQASRRTINHITKKTNKKAMYRKEYHTQDIILCKLTRKYPNIFSEQQLHL